MYRKLDRYAYTGFVKEYPITSRIHVTILSMMEYDGMGSKHGIRGNAA